MKSLLVVIICTCSVVCTFGQYKTTIRTARPGNAIGPFTTGKYVFQVQSGLTHGSFKDGNSEEGRHLEYTNSLRYGLLERLEIRTAFKYRIDEIILDEPGHLNQHGINFWNMGMRYNIWSGSGTKPSFGIQSDVRLTWVDRDYKMSSIAPRVIIIHGQRLISKLRLNTNWSLAWDGNDQSTKKSYVINLSFPIAKNWSGFVENYGENQRGDFDARWDSGVAYLVNKDLQLDLSGGFGNNDKVQDWFVDAGVSWRIKFK